MFTNKHIIKYANKPLGLQKTEYLLYLANFLDPYMKGAYLRSLILIYAPYPCSALIPMLQTKGINYVTYDPFKKENSLCLTRLYNITIAEFTTNRFYTWQTCRQCLSDLISSITSKGYLVLTYVKGLKDHPFIYRRIVQYLKSRFNTVRTKIIDKQYRVVIATNRRRPDHGFKRSSYIQQ